MPGDPLGAEEGQGGMQPLPPEGRSSLVLGRGRGDGTPVPTEGEIFCVMGQGEKLLIPPVRGPCPDTRVCLLEDASLSKHLADFHPKPRTDRLSETGAFSEQGG